MPLPCPPRPSLTPLMWMGALPCRCPACGETCCRKLWADQSEWMAVDVLTGKPINYEWGSFHWKRGDVCLSRDPSQQFPHHQGAVNCGHLVSNLVLGGLQWRLWDRWPGDWSKEFLPGSVCTELYPETHFGSNWKKKDDWFHVQSLYVKPIIFKKN